MSVGYVSGINHLALRHPPSGLVIYSGNVPHGHDISNTFDYLEVDNENVTTNSDSVSLQCSNQDIWSLHPLLELHSWNQGVR